MTLTKAKPHLTNRLRRQPLIPARHHNLIESRRCCADPLRAPPSRAVYNVKPNCCTAEPESQSLERFEANIPTCPTPTRGLSRTRCHSRRGTCIPRPDRHPLRVASSGFRPRYPSACYRVARHDVSPDGVRRHARPTRDPGGSTPVIPPRVPVNEPTWHRTQPLLDIGTPLPRLRVRPRRKSAVGQHWQCALSGLEREGRYRPPKFKRESARRGGHDRPGGPAESRDSTSRTSTTRSRPELPTRSKESYFSSP
jgi:hypothetical protein